MRIRNLAYPFALVFLLSSCATYNFAPPNVEMRHIVREGETFNSQCGIGRTNKDTKIRRSIKGAEQLTDNFLYAYRCAERQVANGRQHFEVPAMLVGLGGAVAAAAGAPAAVALGTGAAVAGLDGGKAYYAPKDKLPILAASVDALVCIKTESLGVDAYGSSLITAATGNVNDAGKNTDETDGKSAADGSVTDNAAPTPADNQNKQATQAVQQRHLIGNGIAVSATHQYFEMVEAALLSVENITAQRLSSVGSYSSDALITEFESLQQKQQASADPAQAQAQQAQAVAQSGAVADAAVAAQNAASPIGTSAATTQTPSAVELSGVRAIPIQDETTVLAADPSAAIAAVQKTPLATIQQEQLKAPGTILVVKDGKPTVVSLDPQRTAITGVLLTIGRLQPKLDGCVLRAKL